MNPPPASASRKSQRAARLAIAAAALALVLLAALHLLRPDLDRADHMISEYALGAHGWIMSLCFATFSASSASLRVALVSHARTRLPRVGLAFLLLAAVGLMLGALFPTDPATTSPDAMSLSGRMHGVGFMVGVPSQLLAVLLLSLWLRKQAPRSGPLFLVLAGGVWLSIVVMVPLIFSQHGFGIPNRTFMVFYASWLGAAAWHFASVDGVSVLSSSSV